MKSLEKGIEFISYIPGRSYIPVDFVLNRQEYKDSGLAGAAILGAGIYVSLFFAITILILKTKVANENIWKIGVLFWMLMIIIGGYQVQKDKAEKKEARKEATNSRASQA